MIVTSKIGTYIVERLLMLPTFNRYFAVAKFASAFKIFRSIPVEKLKRTPITTKNILSFKFDIYDAFQILKEYTAQIDSLEETSKCISIKVWDSKQMNTLIKKFSLLLTDQTFSELKDLLSKKVFNERLGNDYNYFIFLHLQSDIKRIADEERKFAEGTLLYSLVSEKDNKERRMKLKFSLTKQEAITICSNISYWETN